MTSETSLGSSDADTFEITKVADLEYQTPIVGWNTPVVDVYAPIGEGPWPVVVTFHPDMAQNSKSAMQGLAVHLAEHGAVVFNANYGVPGRSSDALRFYGGGQPGCIYSYVYEHAAEFGGDPSAITLVGFSGGANAAAATVMEAQNEIAGCAAPLTTISPVSVILFEGDWALAPFWDWVLENDPDVFEDATVWKSIDTYDGPPLHFLLDRRTAVTASYQIQADAISDYLSLRDSAAMIRDLESLGAFDDGNLDLTEASLLFHHRMDAAGHESTVTWIESAAHTLSREAHDAIAELVFANVDE